MSAARALIASVPDFPKPGIVFRDITPLVASPDGLREAVEALADVGRAAGAEVVIGAEARGFVLGPAVALAIGAGFVLARKPGRLPRETIRAGYALEYGTDSLEVHTDAIADGARVLVHDDLLATGGTATALCELVERSEATVVGCAFLVELAFLGGRARLAGRDVHSIFSYDAE